MVFVANNPKTQGRLPVGDFVARVINDVSFDPTTTANITVEVAQVDEIVQWLTTLGLREGASWDEIHAAHRSLVSDLTPSSGAAHSKVDLAVKMLDEVNEAYDALRLRLVA